MKILGKTAQELLSEDKAFTIPVFQRTYSWQESDCTRLFEDIVRKIKDKTSPHFIGTVCYKESENEALVVDGQQRITSLMLLLMAMRDMSYNKNLQKDIHKNYLTIKEDSPRLILKKKDMQVYQKLLYQDEGLFALNTLTEEDKASKVYKNYNKFYDMLYDFLSKNKQYRLNDFIKAFNKIEFAVIELQTANPQVVFESLNATGVNLTEVDKIRNYILMPLTGKTQDFMYEKYWLFLEKSIGQDMEDFLISYLIIKNNSEEINGEKITSKTLYNVFKSFAQNFDTVMLMKELCSFEKYYQKLHNRNDALNVIFNLLQTKQAMTICIYLLQKEEFFEYDFTEIYEIYLSYVIRGKVCERANVKNAHSAYLISATNTATTVGEFLYLFKKALLQSEGVFKFPNNKEFKEALVNNDIYLSLGSAGVKYLLYEIEKAEMFNPLPIPSFEEGTIEHIMPQTLTPEWETYLEKDKFCYIQNLHTLGNLAITKHNSELSNKPFFEKCKIYNTENYFHTREIAKSNCWGSDSIKRRAKALSNIAVNIWKNLSIEEAVTKNEVYTLDNLHTLNNLHTNLIGIKPSMVFLFGEERQLKSWNDMLYFVASILYEVDTITMLRFVRQDKNPFISTTEPIGPFKKLQEDFYIKTSGTAALKIENLKKLITFYEENSEIDISNNFWFTLQL